MGERTRIVNRMKACLIRLGIRNFKPTLRKAPERLEALRMPEGAPLPPNTQAEMRRDMARLHFVENQIKEIEAARMQKLQQAPAEGPHAMIRLLARVIGVGVETADMLVNEILSRNLRDQKAVVTLRLIARMRRFAHVAAANLRISWSNIINYAAIMIILRARVECRAWSWRVR